MSEHNEYPANPDYGRGCYRRRIRLTATPGQVYGELEDSNHAFCITVRHDGQRVTGLQPDIRRIPFDSCPGAAQPLQQLLGLEISDNAAQLLSQTRPQANCTHLFDLTILAISQAARHLAGGERERVYDIRLDDEQDGRPGRCEIHRNGELVHCWMTRDWTITAPPELNGRVLYKGFREWASECFTGDDAEAAFALQKGYFVGNARRYNLKALAGEPAWEHREVMYGACYTYSSPQIEWARRTAGTVRDFSHTPEQLLQFREA